ncbi:hypothetical protein BCR33DRAFT_762503 [Rhizoclosmatium globosum]|uniref:Uncharacterized protein n=1 Tax=Rhizoclosmatium globosum TaxID=329046 RepID=A0A1Y2CVE3_9FUNG|nr:hypothetical protein BCR33DRAFT_762503 [Rhizoclosmatium globosum]|eukprot:ORY50937.1 hypothetical protein BCR33DRAFT_762503 [Rhizoclosmatium globosum]
MSEPESTTPLDSTADTVVVETVVTTEVVILEDDKAEEAIAATESVAQAESNESSDSAALIADLRAQVAALTQKVASLEAKLALAERANEAAAAPRLVHATKARAGPRRAKAASTEDHADQENEEAPNANRDATTPEPHDGAENEEPTTPQQTIQKKIATMGGVSAFGGAGFNPFAGGASPNVLLKSRSSVTNSSVGGPSEAEAAEALGKADEVKEWVGTTLGDENVKNATNEIFCGELLKDGTLLCR